MEEKVTLSHTHTTDNVVNMDKPDVPRETWPYGDIWERLQQHLEDLESEV